MENKKDNKKAAEEQLKKVALTMGEVAKKADDSVTKGKDKLGEWRAPIVAAIGATLVFALVKAPGLFLIAAILFLVFASPILLRKAEEKKQAKAALKALEAEKAKQEVVSVEIKTENKE